MYGAIIPGLGPISAFFAEVLKFFDTFTHNYTLSVILLTVAFRIVILPLSIKQTKSMIAMQKLQPQLKEIQKKYKDDKEKQGQELMKLYKENKVSPLGGCLPLLIQLPILFALFDVLRDITKYYKPVDVNNTSWSFLGIKNVVATGSTMWSGGTIKFYTYDAAKHLYTYPVQPKQPYPGHEYAAVIILILLTIITGYISAKMMTTDPKQSKMMALMPVLMGVFAWILPAGVTIYIIVTNILTVAQQYIQLERQGFYKERREQRAKQGEPTGALQRFKYNFSNRWGSLMVAMRIRKPEPEYSKEKGGKKAQQKKQPATGSKKKDAQEKTQKSGKKNAVAQETKKSREDSVSGEEETKATSELEESAESAPEKAESEQKEEAERGKPGTPVKKVPQKTYPAKKQGKK